MLYYNTGSKHVSNICRVNNKYQSRPALVV